MDGKLYALCVKARKELHEGSDFGGITHINVICEDRIQKVTNTACHAGLYLYQQKQNALAVVNSLLKPRLQQELDEKEAHQFLDWLLNRSPYSETFISKDAWECLYNKATFSSAQHPSNLMAAGMVASRRLWEYPIVVRIFCDLVNVGVEEDLAYVLGHCLQGAFNREGNAYWAVAHAGHCSLDPYGIGKEALFNFFSHKVVKPNELYSKNTKYHGYDGMYQEEPTGDTMIKFIEKNFRYGAVKKVDENQFAVAKDGAKGSDYWSCISGMGEFKDQILEWVGWKK